LTLTHLTILLTKRFIGHYDLAALAVVLDKVYTMVERKSRNHPQQIMGQEYLFAPKTTQKSNKMYRFTCKISKKFPRA